MMRWGAEHVHDAVGVACAQEHLDEGDPLLALGVGAAQDHVNLCLVDAAGASLTQPVLWVAVLEHHLLCLDDGTPKTCENLAPTVFVEGRKQVERERLR